MVLGRKFSATHYWEEVRKHKVTVIQYIGELCRYLLRVPKVRTLLGIVYFRTLNIHFVFTTFL
jgi:hypothetical protein